MAQTYRHSGRTPVRGLLLAAGGGLMAAAIGAFLYALGIVWIPFIYVNAFLTLGFGALVGTGVYAGALAGKVRNTPVAAALGTACALAALYVAWGADFWIRLARADVEGAHFTLSPSQLHEYASALYEHGSWTLKSNEPVKGVLLAAVWIAEACLIVGTAAVLPARIIGARPFCERCDRWTDEQPNVRRLAATALETLAARVRAGDLKALDETPTAKPQDAAYVRLDLATCPSCRETNFLSLTAVTVVKDAKGKEEEKTRTLVSLVPGAAADVARVREGPPPAVDS